MQLRLESNGRIWWKLEHIEARGARGEPLVRPRVCTQQREPPERVRPVGENEILGRYYNYENLK